MRIELANPPQKRLRAESYSVERPPREGSSGPSRWEKVRTHGRVFGWGTTLRHVVLDRLLGKLGGRGSASGAPDRFDARLGVTTEGYLPANESDIAPSLEGEAEPYQPTHERVLADVLRHVPSDASRFAFVDVGSGLGRVVLAAAAHPFRKVVGVELSEAHCERARANIDGVRRTQEAALACEDIEIVCADVRDLELPQGDLFLFAFNPFGPAVLEAFLDNAIDPKREGEIRFAIVNPTGKEEVLRRFGFDRMQRTDVLSPWWSWSLWRRPALAPSPDSGAAARRATSSFNASKEVRP